ncbi:hypothetical protein B0A54_09880, partial [Friedmanniomyces endolithicus]
MATFASRSAFPTPTMPLSAHYRGANGNGTHVFTSPTESEFSDTYRDGYVRDSVQDWDEARVGEWLKSINCAQYVEIFRRNNINGENLMEVDKEMLKEIGIKKLGDRVRINEKAKAFRNMVYKRTSKRTINRHSLATLDGNTTLTPPSSGSPRPLHSAR